MGHLKTNFEPTKWKETEGLMMRYCCGFLKFQANALLKM